MEEKPRFLSKAEREKLKAEETKPVKKSNISGFFSSSQKQKPVKTVVEKPNPIKEQYLAPKVIKKRRTNDKKFVFDWNEEEDTTKDLDYTPIAPKTQASATYRMDDRHWSEKSKLEMTERDWRIFREDYQISVKGATLPPLRSWTESDIPPFILDSVKRLGYREPTPIQRQAIPLAMSQRDIIGIAETGSGKTASFMIPILSFIGNLPPLDYSNMHLGPYALVLAPTRELAIQIETEAKKLCGGLSIGQNDPKKKQDIIVVSIVGGHSMTSQTHTMIQGAHIIIATPGRLVDMVERRMLSLAQCYFVVLDEADRMCDLGFEDPLRKILDAMPATNLKPDTELAEDVEWLMQHRESRYRQTVMFSATMPTAVEKLAVQ
jgi:ATP-dependent RNA helicase DDX23/PRP28